MKYMKKILVIIFICNNFMQSTVVGQINKPDDEALNTTNQKFENKDVLGYGILKRLPGLWNGPVFSATPAGNFDKWYVDFRPISAGQISQYSMLDSQTVNIISFFIVKYYDQIRVAMRTEGCFNKKCCVTYEVLDSVNEAKGYYRFSDFKSGIKRAYTEYTYTENQFVMNVYTNKFNKVSPLQLHSKFVAKLADRKAANDAISYFKYPQPGIIKDFTNVFVNMTESIFFNLDNDPYSSSSQPYVGNITVNISIDSSLKVKRNDELCILMTTEPLYIGIKYNPENLKYLAKYIYLPIGAKKYTIKNVHPGKYYLYSFNDLNNDKKHLKGDYMSSDLNNIVTVPANGNVTVDTKIDFIIP